METVLISARISKNKKSEFFQVMESLKNLVRNYCKDFDLTVTEENYFDLRIIFSRKEDLESNFYNKEFSILKGTVRSLCNNVSIRINDDIVK